MEPFDITVDYKGQVHEFHVIPHPEEPSFELHQGEISLGKVRNEHDERGDFWRSEELTDQDFLDKIGERIENHKRNANAI